MGERRTAVVVPMFNEASVVGDVVVDLRQHFDHVVCVDDGSTDATAGLARAAGATVLAHPVNLGQGAALETGFAHCRRRPEIDWVVTFDADGQHSVSDALAMVARARDEQLDVVLGSRNLGRTVDQPLVRRLVLGAALRFSRATTGLDLTDTHNGLRVLSRRALLELRLTQRRMAYASELEAKVASLDLRWAEHPVTVSYSAYSLGKGQTNLNAINIMYDLAVERIRAAT